MNGRPDFLNAAKELRQAYDEAIAKVAPQFGREVPDQHSPDEFRFLHAVFAEIIDRPPTLARVIRRDTDGRALWIDGRRFPWHIATDPIVEWSGLPVLRCGILADKIVFDGREDGA